MIANYHTHTMRCNHAVGTEEEYVTAGIKAGLKILGFSDHAPYPFDGGWYSHIRMCPQELGEYAGKVLALGKQYKDQLHICLGAEIEYFPKFWQEQISMLRDTGIEYLLLGQHWSTYQEKGHYNGALTHREDLLADYCRSIRDGMQTGMITYIAHPDLINFTGDTKVYRHHMIQLCRDAQSCGTPLEINLLGIRSGRNYPNRCFWELAAEAGCKVVLGCDAHNPKGLLDPASEAVASDMANTLGLDILQSIPFQSF